MAGNHPNSRQIAPDVRLGEGVELHAFVNFHGCELGSGSILLGGIVIGEHAMVGAGSVVTAAVPPHATVAGNPARHLTNLKEARA